MLEFESHLPSRIQSPDQQNLSYIVGRPVALRTALLLIGGGKPADDYTSRRLKSTDYDKKQVCGEAPQQRLQAPTILRPHQSQLEGVLHPQKTTVWVPKRRRHLFGMAHTHPKKTPVLRKSFWECGVDMFISLPTFDLSFFPAVMLLDHWLVSPLLEHWSV